MPSSDTPSPACKPPSAKMAALTTTPPQTNGVCTCSATANGDAATTAKSAVADQLNGKAAPAHKINGAVADKADGDASTATEEDEEPCDPGMKSGVKNLYSGKEDDKGRFTWQDTIPKDIGKPAEDDASLKWALIVRNVRVYNDPQKVMAVQSIVVQSPLLKKLLSTVLKNYPGVTAELKRLEFSGQFQPLIHRWAELQKAIDELDESTEDGRTTKDHALLLREVLQKECSEIIDVTQDMKSKRVMTYEHLWTLFQPGSIVYTRLDGQETAMKLESTRYAQDCQGRNVLAVRCKYIDWDGVNFGYKRSIVQIPIYSGTRPIQSLKIYPIEYHADEAALRRRLIERGLKTESLAGPHYKAYNGVAWRTDPDGSRINYNVKGRVVLDTHGWNRFNPIQSVFVLPLNMVEHVPDGLSVSDDGDLDDDDLDDDDPTAECCCDDFEGAIPIDGQFADEDESAARTPLTNAQKLVCTPTLRGYSLQNKRWLNFFVGCVHEIEWQTDAFKRLVLPENEKELILGFTDSQRKHGDMFDDFIEGKGRGMVILLCGPPGVGKTLTAESVAEEMKVPLYTMSAGDLGLDPRFVETKLQEVLAMCTRWKAVLLLDEADVFLEQRGLHELERNKLVTIFLRMLEYFEGTMFLTTNRVNTFDPAFQSRIHISISYKDLTKEARRIIWVNFLDTAEHTVTKEELKLLADKKLNGRQIKNILKIARLLASRKEEKLGYQHVIATLDVTQHLHNEAQFADNLRGTMYH